MEVITNWDITVYNSFLNPETRFSEWRKTVIRGVWFYEDNKVGLTDGGLVSADMYKVRIPTSADFGDAVYVPPELYAGGEHTWTLKNDDYIVLGILMIEIDKPSDLQKGAARSVKITSWSDNRHGGLKHWRIGGV